ncbi:MAG TPA: Rne/Rng family ribonuclease [Candidatus Acidoferrum sp.]|jgi:Rne/Rng family ribonuclease|nr:Rne/Rng family ribonuclease [Candidatus Acidoferrum sp.]
MNKELFVSSTPHETKVGLVEDDLLAEIYLERENEYTLAGSIYKGRVTRVLPGMQSAFVDIGLERDAFLYVSDFMELEEHDEDLTDVVPANRGVQDMRQPAREESAAGEAQLPAGDHADVPEASSEIGPNQDFVETGEQAGSQPSVAPEASGGGASQERERGGYRGRRRRRGGRRDGRGDGRGEARGDGRDRGSEPRLARPAIETAPAPVQSPVAPRHQESGRSQQFGPPAGYQPILLPGESISKYRGLAQVPVLQERRSQDTGNEPAFNPSSSTPASAAISEPAAPVAEIFPEDEPIFASAAPAVEIPREQPRDSAPVPEDRGNIAATSEASTTVDWNREFHRQDSASANVFHAPGEAVHTTAAQTPVEEFVEEDDEMVAVPERSDQPAAAVRQPETPAFAAPGTLEEETIDEEEADTVHYEESSDEGYDEFEEETRAAGQSGSEMRREISEVRETVEEIHMSSLAEAGVAPAADGSAEVEEDSEELELEEAQAEAEALLDAEARGTGAVDARAEVRAPAGTAGYTQRAPRPRPGYDRRGGGRRGGGGRRFPRRQSSQDVPKISDLLKEGQEILVQIAKEPIGKKGARITSHIALPGRFLVYMPTVNHTGVSRKIASDEERQRLKRIVLSERDNGHGGFIVRTAAQNAGEDELRADIRFLKGLWNDIKSRAEASKPPALIYHDLNVVERVLRDQVTSDFSVIWVDTEPEYERILRFFNRFQPGLVKRVKLYTKETPLFEQFGLKDEMDKALKSKVWLKSGGYIVINQTEALVAIDINTGKYVGKTSRLEDTIVKTNVDAIKEIVRQIRLRDLGGIIIIDFIDMDERRNRQRVMQALEEELRHDRAPSKVLQFNDFGLVAITRKRVKQSLERTIGAPCPYCQSTGYVKSLTTVANEIYVEMRKIAKHLEHEDVMLRVNPDVAKELKANNGRLLNEMEELTKRTIIVKSDPALHQEQFDIN